jgi:hypothetical protein
MAMPRAAILVLVSVASIGQVGCLARKQNAFVQGAQSPPSGAIEILGEADESTTIGRQVLPNDALLDCQSFGLPYQPTTAYFTPNGPEASWTFSNELVSRYREANGMFPQTNFAITLFMAEFLARDPWLNFEKMKDAFPTEEQVMSVAKVMTQLHKQAGVKYSSVQNPIPETQTVPDNRILRLMRGGTYNGVNLIITSILRLNRHIMSATIPFDDLIRKTGDVGLQESRCRVISTLTRIKQIFRDPALTALNNEWKAGITSGEDFKRDSFYQFRILPTLKDLFEKSARDQEDRRIYQAIFDGL